MAYRGGYFRVPRYIFQTPEWQEKRVFTRFEALIWLWAWASYTDGRIEHVRGMDISLRRGQLVTSIRILAKTWGWDKSSVDRFLKKLRDRNEYGCRINIETVKGTISSIVTIIDYDNYDSEITCSETVSETVSETHYKIRNINKSNKNKEIPTNQLVRDFKNACACADEREAAYRCFNDLQSRGYYCTEGWKTDFKIEYKFLWWIWRYYPDLQMKFEAPLITWQSRDILEKFPVEDVKRVIERMSNSKGIENKYSSVYSTLKQWLRSDFELKEKQSKIKSTTK